MVDQYPFPQNMTRYQPEPNTGCWLWEGGKSHGYGAVWFQGKTHRAHRVSYFLTYGEWPEFLDHRCFQKACINPKHLNPVASIRENLLRSVHYRVTKNEKKSQCPHGHAYDGVNNQGGRFCRECSRAQARAWKQRVGYRG